MLQILSFLRAYVIVGSSCSGSNNHIFILWMVYGQRTGSTRNPFFAVRRLFDGNLFLRRELSVNSVSRTVIKAGSKFETSTGMIPIKNRT